MRNKREELRNWGLLRQLKIAKTSIDEMIGELIKKIEADQAYRYYTNPSILSFKLDLEPHDRWISSVKQQLLGKKY